MFANKQNRPYSLTPPARRLILLARFLWGPLLLLGVMVGSPAQPLHHSQERAAEAEAALALASRQALVRVQNLVRANVLGLAREILETRGPAMRPTPEWLQWERQLWALYRVQGQWQKLYERTQRLPPAFPRDIRQEAQLQAVASLTALQRESAARSLIRMQLLATDASQQYKRRLRQSLIAAYLADDLLPEARIAMENFRRDYGSGETDWLLLGAGVLFRSGDLDAAINLLAPLDQPEARLLRLYARLGNGSLTPDEVIDRALELKASPAGKFLQREIQAVIAQANITADKLHPLADALEIYLLAPRNPALDGSGGGAGSGVYPQFEIANLFDVYAKIAHDEANKAGLLTGEERRWLDYAQGMPPSSTVVRKSLFAYLADGAHNSPLWPAFRQSAVDGYVDVLIDTRRTGLIAHLFGPDARLGELSLGGETGLRLSAHALDNGDFQLAAEANANLWVLPAGVDRTDWLLQAGRTDILAGKHEQGAMKLTEWVDAHRALSAAQTDAVLQPIFDLQTVEQHSLALELLHKVDALAPAGKHRREIAYWLAESYHGSGQYTTAADLFLHSALQQADGFDRWGGAARFRAAESLMAGGLFDDARRLFEDMLVRAESDASRNALKQKLQRLWLLESSPQNPPALEHDNRPAHPRIR